MNPRALLFVAVAAGIVASLAFSSPARACCTNSDCPDSSYSCQNGNCIQMGGTCQPPGEVFPSCCPQTNPDGTPICPLGEVNGTVLCEPICRQPETCVCGPRAPYECRSSARFKSEISESPYGLAEIRQLQPKTYYYNDDATQRRHIGLIAEEVARVVPEVVVHEPDGKIYGLDYTQLSALLIQALKTEDATVARQAHRIRLLEQRLEKIVRGR